MAELHMTSGCIIQLTVTEASDLRELGAALRLAVRAYARLQRRSALVCGSAGHARCLVLTELASGPLPQRELGERLDLDKAWVSRIVRSLLTEGLVRRGAGALDGRVSVLALTQAGRRAAAGLHGAFDRLNERVLLRLPADERAHLLAGLRALSSLLAEELSTPEGGG
jgi:DNA-binding MarR family transcriptional regulator